MYSADYLNKFARDRHDESLRYAARQRLLPSFRQRLAYKLQALALWLEPEVKAEGSRANAPLTLERA